MDKKKQLLKNTYGQIHQGLLKLHDEVQKYAVSMPDKIEAMENSYLITAGIYSSTEISRIKYFRKAVFYKFHLAVMHLEQLWSFSHMEKPILLRTILENLFDSHDFKDKEQVLPSFVVESILIQSSSFLDFYMLYLVAIFKISFEGKLSGKKFMSGLEKVQHEPLKPKAHEISEYINKNVFSRNKGNNLITQNWGNVIMKLRDSTVHRDIIQPNFDTSVSLLESLIGVWPEHEKEVTCDRFFQDIQNDMFRMVVMFSEIIYDLKWIPGPYNPINYGTQAE